MKLIRLVVVAALLAAGTVGAATITGTPGNDTLRGGPAADKLAGKGGHDKLYGAAGNDVLTGGPGNDLLVGGPGADKLSCGAGTDTARADDRDEIAAGCEVVRGLPTPEQPPPTPSPPTQPPPYVGPVAAGSYQGQTESGNRVFLTVRSDRTFTGWLVVDDLPTACQSYFPGGDWFVDTAFSIGDDGTFDARRSGGSEHGRGTWNILYERGQVVDWEFRIAGRFDSATSASGTIAMDYELEHRDGLSIAHVFCSAGSTGPIEWSATLRPPQLDPVTSGSYQGRTENGNPVFLTVRSDRTFTGLRVGGNLPSNCFEVSPDVAWFVDTTFGIRDDGTFDAQPRWEGSIIPFEASELTNWDARIAGRFDTATSVSGTIFMTFTIENQDYGRLHCSSQYMRWSATLRE